MSAATFGAKKAGAPITQHNEFRMSDNVTRKLTLEDRERMRFQSKHEDGLAHGDCEDMLGDLDASDVVIAELRADNERLRDDVATALVFLRQECARVAHEKSGDVNVGHEVGRVDVLPFLKNAETIIAGRGL